MTRVRIFDDLWMQLDNGESVFCNYLFHLTKYHPVKVTISNHSETIQYLIEKTDGTKTAVIRFKKANVLPEKQLVTALVYDVQSAKIYKYDDALKDFVETISAGSA